MPRAKANNFQDYFKKLKVSEPEKNIYVKILIAVVTIVIISLMLPSYKNIDANIEVGTIWSSEDLIAPFSFPIYKDEADLESEKKEVYDRIIPVFIEVTGSSPRLRDTLSSYFRKFNALISLMSKQDKQVKKPEGYKNLKDELNLNLTDEQWSYLIRFSRGEVKPEGGIKFSDFEILIQKGIVESLRYPIINYDKAKIVSQKIAVKRNDDKTQKIEALERYSTLGEAKKTFSIGVSSSIKDNDLIIIAEAISDNFIKETLFYDKELTELEIKNRIEQIPKTVGIVRENERIISKHDPITKLTKLKLDSFKKIRLERLGVQDFFAQALGKILTVIMLIIILGFYLFHLRRDVFEKNSRMALISSLMILVSFFAFMSLNLKVNAPVELLIFVSVASILLTILFDSRLSFFVVVIITFLVAAIRGGDYTIAFISLSGSILAIFSVRDIKNRSQIFRSFFFVIAGYSVAIIAVGLDRSENLSKIAVNLSYAAVNAIMSPVIAYGLLIFYEKVFRITTDITLIELADFNQPLLRELSAKAPGTFHHSVVMGNLSEEAAASIGANRVLARVGSYYHDIGKSVKPDFFVENQLEKKNKHEGMNPTLSAKVIIAHVKEGIELARRYRLPQEVIDFIPMHHGTTLVSFFYNKAKNLTDENKEDVLDYIYRYPGPKPQNKETAIVMLADTVEASTKAIEDPTPKKLEDKIDEIIKKRFIEGELDDCNLTLKDLTSIKKSFLKILIGIYHQRIKYPEEKAENG